MCCLYRHFDKSGALLYIGVSGDVQKRTACHANSSAWWENVATMTIERFPNAAAAFKAESAAIVLENPKHNVKGSLINKPQKSGSKCNLGKQIMQLVPDPGFIVYSESARQEVCRTVKLLKEIGDIDFDVITCAVGDGSFKVAAI